ncbi:MAG: 8-oxo-dGTP diphosphatase [Verrucomicrobiales bacterium]|jgi:8-oxo-dGTP diphosphatase
MKVDWRNWEPTIRANLLFVVEDGRVLLIRKKRGLGAGKINGPGGKLDPGETALESALREVDEELCIQVEPSSCQEMGVLRFQFVDGLALHCTVFRGTRYAGTPTETDEAIPLWFALDEIPYDEMWADDRHWLGRALDGQRFSGDFLFDDEKMLEMNLEWLA